MKNRVNPPGPIKLTTGRMLRTAVYLLIFPALLLLLSGDWLWIEGWVFSVWFIVMCGTTILYLYRKDPALLAERYKRQTADQPGWDRLILWGIIAGFLLWIVVIPLDAKRFGWSPEFPVWLKALGGIGLLPCFFLFYRAYTDNPFLSPLVRIQTERKQQLVSTGVYGFVRHPMYLAGVLLFIATPALLGSVYGILIGVALSLIIAARIVGEERMLVRELEGYAEYRKKVRYRLVPFVW